MANAADISLHALGAETLSGSGTATDITAVRSCVELALIVGTVSGTDPALTVTIETAPLEAGPWRAAGAFSEQTAIGKTKMVLAELDQWVRASWLIGGTDTPTFSFSVAGQAHTLYAEPSDIPRTAINQTAIEGIAPEVLADCCLRATADAETALNSSYELPITAWSHDLRGHCAARAMFYAINHRGFDPGSGPDQMIVLAGGFRNENNVASAAQMFFDKVANGQLKPVGIIDQTPDDYEGAGFVASGTPTF